MRSIITCATMLATTSTAIFVAPAMAAQSYCSESGDLCTSVAKRHGVRYVALETFSLKGRVQVCAGSEFGFDCKPFKLRPIGSSPSLRGFRVRWVRHFGYLPPGWYRLSFEQGGEQIGPTLSFRYRR